MASNAPRKREADRSEASDTPVSKRVRTAHDEQPDADDADDMDADAALDEADAEPPSEPRPAVVDGVSVAHLLEEMKDFHPTVRVIYSLCEISRCYYLPPVCSR